MKKKTKKNLAKIAIGTFVLAIIIFGNMYKSVNLHLYEKGEDRIEYSRNILTNNGNPNKIA